MFEEAPAPVTQQVELDQLLLDAKLSVPEATDRFAVSRAALIEAARRSGRRVVGVTAPAGYGKSTLLAEWAHTEQRPVAWVSLDRFDDDPATLLGLLASAFAGITPGMEHLAGHVRGHSVSALARAAPLLASALRAAPAPFVLIVDDLHELRTPACQDVLSVALDGVPGGSQVVVASRSEQAHLARLRASGDALEVGVADLALDADAAAKIFARADVLLTPEAAAEVVERVRIELIQVAALIERRERAAVVHDDVGARSVLHACARAPTVVAGFRPS